MSIRKTQPESPLVNVSNLTRQFVSGSTRNTVLDDISFAIDRGNFAVIWGPSGCGKTTLLNLLGAMDVPNRGDIVINGRNLGTMDETARTHYRRHELGFIFQSYNLLPTLTVRENLELPLRLVDKNVGQRAPNLLSKLRLADKADAWPDQLSGGEQQRIAILRALIHEPTIIIADEPTGNLDVENADDVIALLLGLVREHGTTLIMATHNQRIAKQADRLFELRAGKILQSVAAE